MKYEGITFIGNALFFGFFSLISIIRFFTLLINSKQKYWIWIPFYILLFFCSIVRGGSLAFIGITLDDTKDDFFQELLMASPYMVYLLAFLLLVCHFLIFSLNAHINLANDKNIFSKELSNLTKKTLILMFIIFPIFLLVFILLSIFALCGILAQWTLIKIISIFNITSPAILLAYYIFLNVKFSGRPYRDEKLRQSTNTIFKICILWSATRIISGIIYLIFEISDLRTLIRIESDENEKFVNIILIFVFFIVLEILPIYFSLDHPLKKTFIKEDSRNENLIRSVQKTEEENLIQNSMESISKESNQEIKTVITNNLQPNIKDFLADEINVVLGEKIYEKKNGLGLINKGKYKGKDVVLRIIHFERLSRYNIENIVGDLEKIIILSHTNISGILGYYLSQDNKVVLISEEYSNGSLFDYIHIKKNALTSKDKTKISEGIIQGLKYLHKNKIIHSHLSSKNILLDKNLNPFITDYGFWNLYELANIFNKYSNKNSYSPPEVLCSSSKFYKLSDSFSDELKKIDIYSYGMILWELITNTVPFNIKLSEVKKYVIEEKVRPEIPKDINISLSTLIRNCWDSEACKRPSEEDIIKYLKENPNSFESN